MMRLLLSFILLFSLIVSCSKKKVYYNVSGGEQNIEDQQKKEGKPQKVEIAKCDGREEGSRTSFTIFVMIGPDKAVEIIDDNEEVLDNNGAFSNLKLLVDNDQSIMVVGKETKEVIDEVIHLKSVRLTIDKITGKGEIFTVNAKFRAGVTGGRASSLGREAIPMADLFSCEKLTGRQIEDVADKILHNKIENLRDKFLEMDIDDKDFQKVRIELNRLQLEKLARSKKADKKKEVKETNEDDKGDEDDGEDKTKLAPPVISL